MELKQLETGQVFELAGYEWIVLEHNEDRNTTLVVAKECVEVMPFDTEGSNDYRNSSIRKYLNNDFLEVLTDEGVDEDSILFTDFDLLDCQGGGAYGFCRDKIGLLTIDQYRKHKEVLALNDRWWLITPNSGNSRNVRLVNLVGSLIDHYACGGSIGVRPALVLDSDISVQADIAIGLEDYSSEALLQELLRRESNSY